MKKIVDISEHNGNIDFKKLKQAGIDTCIIRIGWIGNKENHTIDKKFEEYYKEARKNGFKIGFYVYSYCKNSSTVLSGSEWVKRQLNGKYIDLPVFIDLEDNTIKNLGKEELTSHATIFCNYLLKHNIKKVGVYASLDWFKNKLDINKLLDYKIWLAEWTKKENHSFKYRVDLWQYTSDGHVSGILGRVDLNKCLCNCVENVDNSVENVEKGQKEVFEVAKTYKNGSTPEDVYSDSLLKYKIGSLNKYEVCECLGIVNSRYIVKYKIDGTNTYKVGFVKYHGGIK